jgi:drug/metabolite transporter (DMT)-like permease
MISRSSRIVGVNLGIASSTCFGASGSFAKSLTDAGFSPLQAVWMRVLGASVILTLGTLALRGGGAFTRIWRDRTARRAVVAFGLVVVASCQGLYFVAASRLPVGVASLLEFTGPVLVVLYLRLIRRQHVRPAAFLGIGLAMAGLCCVVEIWSGVQFDALGLAAGLGAAAGNATYFVLLDKVAGTVDALSLTTGGMVVGAVALAPLATPWRTPWHLLAGQVPLGGHRLDGWFVMLLLVLLSTVIAYVMGGVAVQRLSAAVAAGISYVEPVSSALFAWALLGERLAPVQITGGLIVLSGAYVAQRAAAQTRPAVIPAAAGGHQPAGEPPPALGSVPCGAPRRNRRPIN